MVADCTCEVVRDVRETSGTLVIVLTRVVVELSVSVEVTVSVFVVFPLLLDEDALTGLVLIGGWLLAAALDWLVVEIVDVLEETWLLNDALALLVTDVSDDILVDVRSLETAAAVLGAAAEDVVGDGDGVVDVEIEDVVCCAATPRVEVDELALSDDHELEDHCDLTTSLVTVVVPNKTWLLLVDENVSVYAIIWTCPSESCCTAFVGCHGTVLVLV